MNIAIDCRYVLNPGRGEFAGIGHYVYFLVRHLLRQDEENRYTLFFDDRATKSLIAELIGGHQNARAKILPFCRYKKYLPYAYAHHLVASAIAKERADVFHAPSGSLPLGYAGANVITVHDLAIYLHPEWFPGGQLFARRIVVPSSVRRARRIIAVSHSTKRDLQRIFSAPAEKISVVHEGVPPAPKASPVAEAMGDRPYFLFLGTIEPRKNVDGLARAYETLVRRFPKLAGGTELVIAGERGWKSERTFARIEAFNKKHGERGPKILMPGYVAAEDKAALMAHALAFVFPSFYEGFGLPVLEAMSLGAPVITSNLSSLPEVTGRAALLIDPRDDAELVLAMKHLLEDSKKRRELGRKGYERSLEFRWEKTAGETLEVYEAAARGPAFEGRVVGDATAREHRPLI